MIKKQRKMSIILFADILGVASTREVMDAESVINFNKAIKEDIASLIISNNGVIEKHNDNKIIATWGIKSTYREDPFLAAKVALELVNLSKSLKTDSEINIKVGMHYGPLVSIETGVDNEFTIMGDELNTTEELVSTAENGTVRISMKFADLISNQYKLKQLRPIRLKGKNQPIQTFRLLEELEHKKEIKFVYFDDRVNELIGVINTDNRKVKYHSIFGHQGTGKTELLREYSNIKKNEPDSILLYVSAQHRTSRISLFILEQLLNKITKIFNINDDNLVDLSLEYKSELIIRKLLHYIVDDVEVLSESNAVFSAVIEFISSIISENSSYNRIIISIDEYDYIDESSKKFLSKLSEDYLNIEIVIITTNLTSIENELYLSKELKALDYLATKKLLYEISNVTKDDQINNLLKQSNGNLLFILEMDKYYSDSGVKDLPESFKNLVQIQLESLSDTTLKLVKCASTCGVVFPTEFVNEYLGQSNLKECYQEAFDKSLIYLDNPDENTWSFSNNSVYNLVYESVFIDERKIIHKSYAIWLEKKDITPESIHFIAYHYYKSEEYGIAFDYYFKILKKYCEIGQYFDAKKALDTIKILLRKINVEGKKTGEFYYYSAIINSRIFKKGISDVIMKKAYEIVNYENYTELYKKLVILNGDIGDKFVDTEQMQFTCTKIKEILKRENDSYLETLLYFYEGSIEYVNNDHDAFLVKQEAALEIAKKYNHQILVSKIQVSLAGVYTLRSRYKDAENSYLEAIDILEKNNTNQALMAKSVGGLGVIYGDTGKLLKYEEYMGKAYMIIKNSERGLMYTLIMLNLIEAKVRLGKYREFKEYLFTLLNAFKKGVNTRMITPTFSIVSRYFFSIGDLDKAYMYIGYSYNCPPNFRSSIDYVNSTIFDAYPKEKPENLEELISKWKTDNLDIILRDMIDNFQQLFSRETV